MPILPLAAVAAIAGASIISHNRRRRGGPNFDSNDEGYHDTGGRTFWGQQGTGVMLTTGDRILLNLRSEEVEQPGTWGIPGGAVPKNRMTGDFMDLHQAAVNELEEEDGIKMSPDELRQMASSSTVFSHGQFRYTTFIARVDPSMEKADVRLNWESDDWHWFTPAELADIDLHFGVKYTLSEAWGEIFKPSAPGFAEGRRMFSKRR